MKVVICGSYGDLKRFQEILEQYRKKYGKNNVFPSNEHLKQSEPCIESHHGKNNETNETLMIRSKLMNDYFDQIEKADIIVINNEKNGMEYYGIGTTIELGFAYARKKRIIFTKDPTNPNIRSLIIMMKKLQI